MINHLPKIRDKVQDLIIELEKFKTTEIASYKQKLEEGIIALKETLDKTQTSDVYKVAIVGSFKVGKSSFLNTICGFEKFKLASVDANPETAAITIFKYSSRAYAEVNFVSLIDWNQIKKSYEENNLSIDGQRYSNILSHYQNDQAKIAELEAEFISNNPKKIIINCDDWNKIDSKKEFSKQIKKYISRQEPIHYLVEKIVIYAPIDLLIEGIELIDTPGLDDTDRYRVKLTEEYVKDVDVILFLTQSGNSYSQSNKEFIIERLRSKKLKSIRLIVTKCDLTFESAKSDAENNDEEYCDYDTHLSKEHSRLTEQIANTLKELLSASNIDSDHLKEYYSEQLSSLNIDFISSKYYREGKKKESGIEDLKIKLFKMLEESERINKAIDILEKETKFWIDKYLNIYKARLKTTANDFNSQKIIAILETIHKSIDISMETFKKNSISLIELLKKRNYSQLDLTKSKIESILLISQIELDRVKQYDLIRHWRTKRIGNWGTINQLQNSIADKVFPTVEDINQKYFVNFQQFITGLKVFIDEFKADIKEIEYNNKIELEEFDISSEIEQIISSELQSLSEFIEEEKDKVILRLSNFIKTEASDEIENRRYEVSNVYGKGTAKNQNAIVESFYRWMINEIKNILENHLTTEINRFAQLLESKSEYLLPQIQVGIIKGLSERKEVIKDTLQHNNENEKQQIIKISKEFLEMLDKIQPLRTT